MTRPAGAKGAGTCLQSFDMFRGNRENAVPFRTLFAEWKGARKS